MAQITFDDKVTAQNSPLPAEEKLTAADVNEIKNSVNTLYGIDGVLVGVAGAVANIGEGTTGQVLTSAGAGAAPTWQNASGGGFRTYQATLTQGGTTEPFDSIFNNTLGGQPLFAYIGPGSYTVDLTGLVSSGAFMVMVNGVMSAANDYLISATPSGTTVLLETTAAGTPSDDIMSETPITIIAFV